MEAIQEVTVYESLKKQPNHIYLIDETKLLAYIKWGSGSPIKFDKPLRFYRSNRKFIKSDIKLFKDVI